MEPLNQGVASVGRWKRERAALERRLDSARSFHGLTASAAPVGQATHLRRGERLFLVIERAVLIEPRGLSVDAAAALDRGTATITDRRVVFEGAKHNREWAFGKLVEHRHYERRPTTMLEVSNRVRTSGIAYDATRASDVRFLFDLALAHHDGTVEDLQHEIERQLIRHDARRPGVHAGAWVWRGWAHPVPVASAILTAIVVAGALLVGPSDEPVRQRALEARGDGLTTPDFSNGFGEDGAQAVADEPTPIVSTAGASRGRGPASAAPTPAPTPPSGCAAVVVIGPVTIPDPLCTLT